MSKPLLIPEQTRLRQDRASQPQASAWVSANAGSGKTFVLSRRVVRLLLEGAEPSRILCLTFTKAAAAEMATRVFRILGEWVTLDDEALAAEITSIEGHKPKPQRLAQARRLFARALETPGGLKIQTIHGFCEALLHQFPLEANVAGHFQVLDDRIASDLMTAAREHVLCEAENKPESRFGQALAQLVDLMPDASTETALNELISRRDALRRWIDEENGSQNALDNLAKSFGLIGNVDLTEFEKKFRIEALINDAQALEYADILLKGSKTDQKAGILFEQAVAAQTLNDFKDKWLAVFFTAALKPRASLATRKTAEAHPEMMDMLDAESQRLQQLLEVRKAVVTMTGTRALLCLAEAIIQYYEKEKSAKGYLDFEDLIVRTATLLSRSDAAQWVQYKLDQGLDHILVDEAQDTSPRQWQIIKVLAEEFFSGAGGREAVRTIFAVGDEKQSIYSFQGAVPAYFDEMRRSFERQANEAGRLFHSEDLYLSFRSTPDVLGAVDRVFEPDTVHKGLSRDLRKPVHEAIRNDPGIVEIWPLELPQESPEPEDWRTPLDHVGAGNPIARLAGRIASSIRQWMDEGMVDPGSVMILVRKRGAFVDALNRELKQLGVPAAGSDRLILTEHIAVQDLVSLGRFMLLPEDDLSLAEVLKSPLIGLDDDDLIGLARETPETLRPGTLWQSLQKKSHENPVWQKAQQLLETWRSRADFMPPYEFYAELLASDGGRQRFRERLGVEVDDVLDEFLALTMNYEQAGIPGLQGFLAWLEAAPTEIKRELANARGMVRIMTVHGSKGLEAGTVILVDPGSKPVTAQHDPVFLEKPRQKNPLLAPALVWRPVKADATAWHTEKLAELRDESEEEYRRLLYVALTRAEDRLIVCGWAPKAGPPENGWYNLVTQALLPDAEEIRDTAGEITAWRWKASNKERSSETCKPVEPSVRTKATSDDGQSLPEWLSSKAPPFKRVLRLQPSHAFEEMELKEKVASVPPSRILASALESPSWPLEKGRLIHRLLELLPQVACADRIAAAERFLQRSLPQQFAQYQAGLIAEVEGILQNPDFEFLFAPDSLSEVPVAGDVVLASGTEVFVSGQIDRLLVSDTQVVIIDYKTNLTVPDTAANVPVEYLAQMSVYRRMMQDIYPGKRVEAALLWTSGPEMMFLPQELMDETWARLRKDGSAA